MKRILFVDDETSVLEALAVRLHHMADRWDVTYVESGARAIDELDSRMYDVVVSDMHMPHMNGGELLREISERWPDIIRLLMREDDDAEQAIRLVPHAHQYLSKPCDSKRLETVIDRCLSLHQLLVRPSLRAVVGRIKTLPAMPRIYTQLRDALSKKTVTVNDVAKIVVADPVIATKILRLVNSAFFRLPRRITNIEQAVQYLGLSAIRDLTLSVELFSSWPAPSPSAGPNFERLQHHVHLVAGASRALATRGGMADDALLAGLLHDIGYWILAQECPAELQKSIETAVREQIPLHEAETAVIGASHAEIGAYLLGIWGLPYTVIDAVAHHHTPNSVRASEFDVLAALATAHSLVPSDDAATFDAAVVPDPKVDAEYLQSTNAPFSWAEATLSVSQCLDAENPEP